MIKEMIGRLHKFSDVMLFNCPASEEDLTNFQSIIGSNLPTSYATMLKCFDGGELFVPGTIIYSISKNNSVASLSEINKGIYAEKFDIPHTYLIIGKLNYGDLLCIDLKNTNEIIQWDHEQNVEYCRWDSLEDWLDETISAYIEYESGDKVE